MTDTMRVLTVRQPWAWAIVHGGKDVENRTRNIAGAYRGPVAIHAGHEWAGDDVLAEVERVAGWEATPDGFMLSAIVGVVDLVDVHSASVIGGCGRMDYACLEHGVCRHHCSPWALGPVPDRGWYHHLVLANPRPLGHPIPAKGRLGLWRPDDTLAAAIWEQVR